LLRKSKNLDQKVRMYKTFPLILLLLLSTCSLLAEDDKIIVQKVIDPATIELNTGEIVKYIGIKASDSKGYEKDAIEFNKKLVEGKAIRLEFDDKVRDQDGNLLAYVYCDDVFINSEIIKQGYGLIEIISPNIKYAEDFIKLEREAREARRGICFQNDASTNQLILSFEKRLDSIELKMAELDKKINQLIEMMSQFSASQNIKSNDAKKDDVVQKVVEKKAVQTEKDIVYATRSGKKYHRQGCRFVSKSSEAIDLDEARKRGLEPCKTCFNVKTNDKKIK